MDSTLNIPRPVGDHLYIKLRDDPSIVSIATPAEIPGGAKSPSNRPRKPNTNIN
jgi:hypothetical protein